jgi:hypothetical protein
MASEPTVAAAAPATPSAAARLMKSRRLICPLANCE